MAYTQVNTDDITIRGTCACDEDMVVFDYDGISYVYYTDLVDTYFGMVEEHDITLNPYLHGEHEMHKTAVIGRWDAEKNTAVFENKWLNQDRHHVCKQSPFYLTANH